jgi:hypothetical protein
MEVCRARNVKESTSVTAGRETFADNIRIDEALKQRERERVKSQTTDTKKTK